MIERIKVTPLAQKLALMYYRGAGIGQNKQKAIFSYTKTTE